MKNMEVDIKKVKGKDLLLFMSSPEYVGEELASMVGLLSYATMDTDKAIRILEHVVQYDKTLVTVYPGLGEKPDDDMEFIGSIPDGGLYIK